MVHPVARGGGGGAANPKIFRMHARMSARRRRAKPSLAGPLAPAAQAEPRLLHRAAARSPAVPRQPTDVQVRGGEGGSSHGATK